MKCFNVRLNFKTWGRKRFYNALRIIVPGIPSYKLRQVIGFWGFLNNFSVNAQLLHLLLFIFIRGTFSHHFMWYEVEWWICHLWEIVGTPTLSVSWTCSWHRLMLLAYERGLCHKHTEKCAEQFRGQLFIVLNPTSPRNGFGNPYT